MVNRDEILLKLATLAYVSYGKSTGNKNFRGEEMPTFDALPDAIKKAWIAAATTVFEVARLAK